MTTTDPTTVTIDQIRDALTALGIAYEDVRDVVLTVDQLRVTRYLRNENGRKYLTHGEPAMETTIIDIDWSATR